jgi:hypothetical protein
MRAELFAIKLCAVNTEERGLDFGLRILVFEKLEFSEISFGTELRPKAKDQRPLSEDCSAFLLTSRLGLVCEVCKGPEILD